MCKISLVMPIYNPGIYLQEALESILNQTYSNFELICIDDASTDTSWNLIKEFQKQDKHIKVYVHSVNEGVAITKSEGLNLLVENMYFL